MTKPLETEVDAISEYYDNYTNRQISINVNDRIFGLYQRMIKNGLNSKSNVLELGCGIGTLSFLISKKVKLGTIEAVDISKRSIAFAKQKIKKSNFFFYAGNIVGYQPEIKNPEIITLFDVLEHIPIEQHWDLFQNISSQMTSETILLINLPNPDLIEYEQLNDPDVLQIVDQAVHHPVMVENLYAHNLEIQKMEKYGIWLKDDYIFYTVVKKRPFAMIELQSQRTFLQKIPVKLFRLKLKWFYRYK